MSEKVLLVDDEKDFLDIMTQRMETRGMEVSASASAKEAIEKIKNTSYDAVVLDLQMPEMDGLEALKAIKEIRPEIQIILLTGHGTVEKGVAAIKEGAMDFIEKPADMEKLTEKIKKAQAQKMLIIEKKQKEKVDDIIKRFGF
ncbi:MAG: response regulator [Desulfococcaceae bacterium]|jgi:DNA-binding NtrC family response regulator|nr:response regulator [Desulfococcaceae bacterium]